MSQRRNNSCSNNSRPRARAGGTLPRHETWGRSVQPWGRGSTFPTSTRMVRIPTVPRTTHPHPRPSQAINNNNNNPNNNNKVSFYTLSSQWKVCTVPIAELVCILSALPFVAHRTILIESLSHLSAMFSHSIHFCLVANVVAVNLGG